MNKYSTFLSIQWKIFWTNNQEEQEEGQCHPLPLKQDKNCWEGCNFTKLLSWISGYIYKNFWIHFWLPSNQFWNLLLKKGNRKHLSKDLSSSGDALCSATFLASWQIRARDRLLCSFGVLYPSRNNPPKGCHFAPCCLGVTREEEWWHFQSGDVQEAPRATRARNTTVCWEERARRIIHFPSEQCTG